MDETDYDRELASLLDYEKCFQDYPQYKVPSVFPEFSTKSVLTTSFEEGTRTSTFVDFIREHGQDQHWFAEAMDRLVCLEFFEFGLVQTDPNPGNFLIDEENQVIILLDMGAVKKYRLDFISEIKKIIIVALQGDHKLILDAVYDLGLLDRRESEHAKTVFIELIEHIVEIFRPSNQPFTFSDKDYIKSIREGSWNLIRELKHTAPIGPLLFLNRKLGGVFHILKLANSTINLTPLMQEFVYDNKPQRDPSK